jgi:hypothetical protein
VPFLDFAGRLILGKLRRKVQGRLRCNDQTVIAQSVEPSTKPSKLPDLKLLKFEHVEVGHSLSSKVTCPL